MNLDYNGLVKPTSLRTDLNANSSHQIGIPTAQELFQAGLDEIDEEQEVESAGRSVHPCGEANFLPCKFSASLTRPTYSDLPYEPDFPMPDYKELGVGSACFMSGWHIYADPLIDIVPNLKNPQDRAIIDDEVDYLLDKRTEIAELSLFSQDTSTLGHEGGSLAKTPSKQPFPLRTTASTFRRLPSDNRKLGLTATAANTSARSMNLAKSHSALLNRASASTSRIDAGSVSYRSNNVKKAKSTMDGDFKFEPLDFNL